MASAVFYVIECMQQRGTGIANDRKCIYAIRVACILDDDDAGNTHERELFGPNHQIGSNRRNKKWSVGAFLRTMLTKYGHTHPAPAQFCTCDLTTRGYYVWTWFSILAVFSWKGPDMGDEHSLFY